MWRIEQVSPEDETVHLCKMDVGTQRKFSVPGALTATINNGQLFIQTSTGWVWKVDPETGTRRRFRSDLFEHHEQKD
jgi:hypothetical protein